jgi:hypothetical protein
MIQNQAMRLREGLMRLKAFVLVILDVLLGAACIVGAHEPLFADAEHRAWPVVVASVLLLLEFSHAMSRCIARARSLKQSA